MIIRRSNGIVYEVEKERKKSVEMVMASTSGLGVNSATFPTKIILLLVFSN